MNCGAVESFGVDSLTNALVLRFANGLLNILTVDVRLEALGLGGAAVLIALENTGPDAPFELGLLGLLMVFVVTSEGLRAPVVALNVLGALVTGSGLCVAKVLL